MMWLLLATKHHLTTAHIVISSSSLLLGFHNLIQFLIFLSFLKQNTVSIWLSGNNKLSMTSKSSVYFLTLTYIKMREAFYQNISMRKAIIQKITCSFRSLRVTNLDFTLQTSQEDKKVHNFSLLPEKISLQACRVQCWQNTFRTRWDSFLGTGEAPDYIICSVHLWIKRGIAQIFPARR